MRDYPSHPNVFRAASSHNVNNEATYAPPTCNSGGGVSGIISGQCSSSNMGLQQQQQQQQQQLRQSLGNSAASATVITTIAGGSHGQQQQQQQQLTQAGIEFNYRHNNSNNNNMHNNSNSNHCNNNVAAAAATASGELRQQQIHQQQQPQQLQQQLQPQQYNNHNNNKHYYNKPHNSNHSNGVINTISGSIPATGLKNQQHVQQQQQHSQQQQQKQHRSVSIASNLNETFSCNNSFTDLDAFAMPGRVRVTLKSGHRRARSGGGKSGGANGKTSHKTTRSAREVCANAERNAGGYLWILTPVAASISVAIVIAALAGPQWLYTEEKLPNVNYNGTANFNVLDDGAFITKYTKSSLWILCTTLQGAETYNCIKIDYFPKEGYQPDPLDSTPAIPYTVTKSCPFFLAAGIFLLISFIVFLFPTCSHQNNLFYFSAGIMFIVSGLLMLIGLIAYISILKAEIGSKLRPRSTLQPALFKVNYGQSFFLFVFGFITTEFVGLLNIFLYISLQEVGYYSRWPCFSINNLQAKIKEDANPRSHTYKSYKHDAVTALPGDGVKRQHQQSHQVHETDDGKQQLIPAAFACKKHPRAQAPQLSRYYFEKPPPCDLHTRNLAKSLNELYTEPAPPIAPPPPTLSGTLTNCHGVQTLPRAQTAQFADMPQEFPLTRSVSTTTEIYNNGGGGGEGNASIKKEEQNQKQQQRRHQATNTRASDNELSSGARRQPPQHINDDVTEKATHVDDVVDDMFDDDVDDDDEEPSQRLCGLKRGIRKTKDELFNEFCKRAGVRPKPKNIYFIEDEGSAEEQQQQPSSSRQSRPRRNVDLDGTQDVDFMERHLAALEDDENLFIVDDMRQPQLHYLQQPQSALRSQRRSSMFVDPTPLRKLNSNLSLHSLHPPEKLYQHSLFELDRCDSSSAVGGNMWQTYADSNYARAGAHGGSQSRLSQLDYGSQQSHYQSRTLPRSFLKRNCDSQDSLTAGASRTRLDTLMFQQQQQQQQQQLQQQQRYLSLSRDGNIYHSGQTLHKSCENVAYQQAPHSVIYATAARPQHLAVGGNIASPQQQQHLQPTVQWPAAIPTSPSNFASKSYIYAPVSMASAVNVAAQQQQQHISHMQQQQHQQQQHQQQQQHTLVSRSASNGTAPPKFQRGYAFDEQRRASAVIGDAFDLDEMERERRRSHASLFNGMVGGGGGTGGGGGRNEEHYDMINGTAV